MMKTLVAIGVMSSVVLAFGGRDQNVANWSMSGHVVDAATGRPIAGARVAAERDSRPGGYTTYSDADGAYHFDRVVSGTYYVYVTVTHRTVDPAWRMHDVLDITNAGPGDKPQPRPPVILDVGGKYRLEVDPKSLMSVLPSPAITFATTFYPSAASAESSRRVVIDAGQSRPGIDIGLRRVAGRRVTGTVVGPRFASPNGPGELLVLLSADDVRFHLGGPYGGVATASTLTQEGPFVFMSVPPGTYTIEAWQGVHGDMAPGRPHTRMVNGLTVRDTDVSGVTVTVR